MVDMLYQQSSYSRLSAFHFKFFFEKSRDLSGTEISIFLSDTLQPEQTKNAAIRAYEYDEYNSTKHFLFVYIL